MSRDPNKKKIMMSLNQIVTNPTCAELYNSYQLPLALG